MPIDPHSVDDWLDLIAEYDDLINATPENKKLRA
jgi:hypothetical protein